MSLASLLAATAIILAVWVGVAQLLAWRDDRRIKCERSGGGEQERFHFSHPFVAAIQSSIFFSSTVIGKAADGSPLRSWNEGPRSFVESYAYTKLQSGINLGAVIVIETTPA
jgi:hypothetical protein